MGSDVAAHGEDRFVAGIAGGEYELDLVGVDGQGRGSHTDVEILDVPYQLGQRRRRGGRDVVLGPVDRERKGAGTDEIRCRRVCGVGDRLMSRCESIDRE